MIFLWITCLQSSSRSVDRCEFPGSWFSAQVYRLIVSHWTLLIYFNFYYLTCALILQWFPFSFFILLSKQLWDVCRNEKDMNGITFALSWERARRNTIYWMCNVLRSPGMIGLVKISLSSDILLLLPPPFFILLRTMTMKWMKHSCKDAYVLILLLYSLKQW